MCGEFGSADNEWMPRNALVDVPGPRAALSGMDGDYSPQFTVGGRRVAELTSPCRTRQTQERLKIALVNTYLYPLPLSF